MGNTDVVTVAPGDIIRIASSGAGGWGDPLERDPERVLTDVRCDFISVEAAKTKYKVVIRNDEISADETDTLRQEARKENVSRNRNDAFGFNPYRRDFEAMWTPANYAALMDAIWRLPVDWRFFVKHQVFSRIKLVDSNSRLGDGSEVMAVLRDIAEEYPDIAQSLR